ncbi:MAG: N-glycosylase/DNA lyase [Candidatus Pacearchaeota archaeon]|nr:N-glycosylase/DNA lyase [Candidatus Pacearchaeota archaeon]
MRKLIQQIKNLQNSKTNYLVNRRLKEFQSFSKKSEVEWFSELCFCILAANSKQKTAQNIQKKLQNKLLTISQQDLSLFIKENKHRFHNNKAKFIIEARKFHPIKSKLSILPETQARDFLVKNIKGIGMKEASHFLRNTGSQNLAILDRHVLRTLYENKIIKEIPKSLTSKTYIDIELKLKEIAKELNISQAKLDLLLWFSKTGEVAK